MSRPTPLDAQEGLRSSQKNLREARSHLDRSIQESTDINFEFNYLIAGEEREKEINRILTIVEERETKIMMAIENMRKQEVNYARVVEGCDNIDIDAEIEEFYEAENLEAAVSAAEDELDILAKAIREVKKLMRIVVPPQVKRPSFRRLVVKVDAVVSMPHSCTTDGHNKGLINDEEDGDEGQQISRRSEQKDTAKINFRANKSTVFDAGSVKMPLSIDVLGSSKTEHYVKSRPNGKLPNSFFGSVLSGKGRVRGAKNYESIVESAVEEGVQSLAKNEKRHYVRWPWKELDLKQGTDQVKSCARLCSLLKKKKKLWSRRVLTQRS